MRPLILALIALGDDRASGKAPRRRHGAAAQFGPKRHGRFRRLVREPRRHRQHPDRLLQPQLKEVLDIPVGPNNRVDPGGPDRGQPTHFLPGRQWGVFTITVPKDFGPDKKITWTIVSNGKTNVDSGRPESAVGDFAVQGRDRKYAAVHRVQGERSVPARPAARDRRYVDHGRSKARFRLPVWVADDANMPPSFAAFAEMIPAVTVGWSKFRGPGEVKFENEKPKVEKMEFKTPPGATYTGKSATTATFSQPGEYILEMVANDISGVGGGGFQCCWTTAQVKVTVKP